MAKVSKILVENNRRVDIRIEADPHGDNGGFSARGDSMIGTLCFLARQLALLDEKVDVPDQDEFELQVECDDDVSDFRLGVVRVIALHNKRFK